MTEKITLTEDELEHKLAFSHYGGSASAYEDAAGRLLKEAQQAFGLGHDDHARLIRFLSTEIRKLGEEERKNQKEHDEDGVL